MPRKRSNLSPIHPGQVLQDLLRDAGLTANALALALRVPANRIGAILKGERGITADTALRLARYFGTSAQLWMNLQTHYDLEVAEDSRRNRIEREVLPRDAQGHPGGRRVKIEQPSLGAVHPNPPSDYIKS